MDDGDHHHEDLTVAQVAAELEAEPDESEELHPWAQEMYRQGLSFNGNERSKLFLGRGDGSFEDMSDLCGADSPLDGRGLLCADFDNDGDVDLFVHNLQRERHNLYRNESRGGSSLKVQLEATTSQHEAIGAVVTVQGPLGPTAQLVSRGSGYASCQSPELVFGLGALERGEVQVFWPGGRSESFGDLDGGSTVRLVEGTGKAQILASTPFALLDPLPPGLKQDLGEALPPVRLESADGTLVDLDWEQLAGGDLLYLNLWASYCVPCVSEIPDLERIHAEPNRTVVSISVDVPEARAAARDVLQAAGGTYPVFFIDMEGGEGPDTGIDGMIDLLRLPIPTTLIVEPDGRLRAVVRGVVSEAAGELAKVHDG